MAEDNESLYETPVSKRPKIEMSEFQSSEYLNDSPTVDNDVTKDDARPNIKIETSESKSNEYLNDSIITVDIFNSSTDLLVSNDENNTKSFLDDANADAFSSQNSSPRLELYDSSDSFLDFENNLDTIKTEPLELINEETEPEDKTCQAKIKNEVEYLHQDSTDRKDETDDVPPQFSSLNKTKAGSPLHVKIENNVENVQQDSMSPPQSSSLQETKFVPAATSEEATYVSPRVVFEKEKKDIDDPRWESVRELTSNEQRYKQVKKCWGSTTVPDPDKNLTYHSYRRKKLLGSGELKEKVQPRKRKATSSLYGETKKPCTFLVDQEIHKVEKEKAEENKELEFEMKRAINDLRTRQVQEEICYGNGMAVRRIQGIFFSNSVQESFISNLRREHRHEMDVVKHTYNQKAHECDSKYIQRLEALKGIREEVLQFYKFYKGLGSNAEKDPTILTDMQLKMLDDVENFYGQMEHFYNSKH